MNLTTWVNPARITITATFQVGAAQSISVSRVLFARTARKKSMMYAITNSNVSLDAVTKTLTSARPSWTACKSARETQTARLAAARLTTAQPVPHVILGERLKMIIVMRAVSVRACSA